MIVTDHIMSFEYDHNMITGMINLLLIGHTIFGSRTVAFESYVCIYAALYLFSIAEAA